MKELSLRCFIANDRGRKYRLNLFSFLVSLLLFCGMQTAHAAVAITAATNGISICNTKAVGGSAPAYTTLGPIIITEGINSDFAGTTSGAVTDVIVLQAPTGWQFNPVLPTLSYVTGSNVTALSGTITSSTLTLNITVNNFNGADAITITGLQVQATSVSSPAGYIYASSVTGVAGISTGAAGSNFGNLSLQALGAPSVSIAATPSGAVCPGTNVTFTPTPVNGGAAPTYQWFVNTTSAGAGSFFVSSTLASGNSVSCIMTSSSGCVSPVTATSNSITITLNAVPLPITGTTYTCPSNSITLADATPSGAWSSTNTGIATINSSGYVTGVAAGTTMISYAVSGCAATTVVTVNLPPVAPALSPTTATMCNNGSMAITASGTPMPSTILSQTFNSGLGGWTVDNTGGSGMLPGAGWKVCGDGYINEQGLYHSADSTAFVMANSDTSGSTSYTSTKITSPVFSLAGYSTANLSFQQSYTWWPSGDFNVNLEISTNGGSSWTTLQNYAGASIGTMTTFVPYNYSLNAYLGMTNLMIRFNYYCHWGYYWAIDNILVTGTSSVMAPTWSPVTNLYADAFLTIPYTGGTAMSTVYVHPTTITSTTVLPIIATAQVPGCSVSRISNITVNPQPANITGITSVCVGSTTTLNDASASGTWSSGSPAVATIGSTSGIVSGLAVGNTTISYTFISTGCSATTNVAVFTTPSAILGNLSVCLGSANTLSNFYGGGTWTSTNTTAAHIGASSGVISGLALGTTSVTYSLGAGCFASATATVNPLPPDITGTAVVCAGLSTSLANSVSGGTWSTSMPTIATVNSSGVVTGVAGGNATITYTLNTGCYATIVVTVNPQNAITGNLNGCVGYSSTLANVNAGGTWSSSTTGVATIGLSDGILNSLATGNTTISYILPTGCTSTAIVTVNPLPAAIAGPSAVCVGQTVTQSDATGGGTWSSSAGSLASIGLSSGVVSGVTAGSVNISYTLITTGCFAVRPFSVNPVASISGPTSVCVSSSITLNGSIAGGTWTSGSSTISIGATNGIVNGLVAGTASVTYTLATGCQSVASIVVNPLPAAITGTTNVCVGLTTSLADATTGGTWQSSSTTLAPIGASSGVVSGMIAGTVNISYILPTGCMATTPLTVNPLPVGISSTNNVCVGLTTTLSNSSAGGSWTSGNTGIATIGSSSGIASGVAAGTTRITYTLPTGCLTSIAFTVNPLPAAIGGLGQVCVGASLSLTDATTGGTWTSGNTSIATIGGSSGVVTGVGAGTVTITYTLSTGCIATGVVSVNPLPATITGPSEICVGSTITVADATTGGVWTSSNTAVGSISTGGVVTGITDGTLMLSYTLPTGCYSTKGAIVYPVPSAITGNTSICILSSSIMGNTTPGGTWSSSNPGVSSIGATVGVASGVSLGTAIISYILPTGCFSSVQVTVNPLPVAISGTPNVCVGSQGTLSDATTGGSWTSSNTSVAMVGAGTGIVTGIAPGTATIIYTLPTGCTTNITITVNPVPAAITGSNMVCVGSGITLACATTGGTWSTPGAESILLFGAPGVALGVSAGTATVSYTLSTGCASVKVVSVNALPAAISGGIGTLCQGYTSTLSDATPGGVWNGNNPPVATVGFTTGIVNGVTPGTVTVSYTILSTGCFTSTVMTISPTPTAISGPAIFCTGVPATLSNTVAGGVWSSSATAVATVGASSGVVTGITTGPVTISYTLSAGCAVGTLINISASPASIVGSAGMCVGSVYTFTEATPGGTWTSSNSSVASIGASTGIVNALVAGNTTISYALSSGCVAVVNATVDIVPASITGVTPLCTGQSNVLSDATPGGSWTSSNPSVATIVSGTGSMTGVSFGTATISYSLSTGCMATVMVSINTSPTAISGPLTICQGLSVTYTDGVSGGTWTSNNTSVASIGASTGIANGNAAGTAIIIYSLSNGCSVARAVTVNPLPSPITGTAVVCQNATTTLSDANTGGSWSSNNATIAAVGVSTGVVIGVGPGTTVITYTLPSGCIVTRTVTVNPLPEAIAGPSVVCVGTTATLTDATTSGTWSSSSATNATIGSNTGAITGVAAGNTTITYKISTGCYITLPVTINTIPAITGNVPVCEGLSVSLSNAAAGGTWSSAGITIATVGSDNGVLAGVSTGTTYVSYTLSIGCIARSVVTVNPVPAPIAGPSGLCAGLTTAYSETTPSGTWSTSNSAIVTISTGGVATGVVPGTANISYTLGTGCLAIKSVTVNVIPVAIAGSANACIGMYNTLSDATSGGTWSSSNTAVATIDTNSGVVFGVSLGNATVSYTIGGVCTTTMNVTVNPLPEAITGMLAICRGASTTLLDATAGGTWASNTTAIATITPVGGIVTGIAEGTSTISYTLPTGCFATATMTINATPPISGTAGVCVGLATTLANSIPGGTWISSLPAVATIGASTGIVYGIFSGNSLITYTAPTGCIATQVLTVYPLPAPVTGASVVCEAATITLADATPGGSWSTSDTAIATVGPGTGVVTGVHFGTVTLSYTLGTGCYSVKTITVNPVPAFIIGPSSLCVGLTVAMSDATTGGTWSSSNTAMATIGASSGIVAGVAPGALTVSYTLATGCFATAPLTVHLLTPVSGSSSVCQGQTMTLSNATSGGTWSSSNAGVATVDMFTGIVAGINPGTATISYSYSTGCVATKIINVNPIASIDGALGVCQGSVSTLSNSVTGGTWSSSAPAVATIGVTSGVVTPIASGTTAVTYTLSTGCKAAALVTIYPLAPITGASFVCEGTSLSLSNAIAGGVWSSDAPTVASVGIATGIVTGEATGTTTITYTLPTGCFAIKIVSVHATPAAIMGAHEVCVGAATTLSCATPGGTWSSTLPSVATVGLSTGVVSGTTAGVTVVMYQLSTGCMSGISVTVNPLPAAISGSANICFGVPTTLTSASTGGSWSSSAPAILTADTWSGVVTGIAFGTAQVTYTIGTGCTTSRVFTVTPQPGTIAGSPAVCLGTTVTFSNSLAGGTWSSSNITSLTIGVSTGVASGAVLGTSNITYQLPTGCFVSRTVTVEPLPVAITGAATICAGTPTVYTDATPGGSWTASASTIATVNATSGEVTGLSAGLVTISYTLATGCFATKVVSVHPVPAPIVGTTSMCSGATTTLTNSTPGGVWSAPSSGGVASVSAAGIVTGGMDGTAIISYTLSTGCAATTIVTVFPVPSVIVGSSSVCAGSSVTLSDPTPTGTWSSGSANATIGSSTGIVVGVTAGTARITYSLGSGCFTTAVITISVTPPAISGSLGVCVGYTSSLTNTIAGGTWLSSATSVAAISLTSGVVLGVSQGTSNVTYTLSNGCLTSAILSVNPLPASISGTASICQGATFTFTDATPGGLWTTSNASIASVGGTSGIVTGVASGAATITYSLLTGCYRTSLLTVYPAPPAIGGTPVVCETSTTTLTNSVAGGTWSSSAPGIAVVGASSGVVTGMSAGTVRITYTVASGCYSTVIVTVNVMPGAIAGSLNACLGETTTLTSATSGGTWTSSTSHVDVGSLTGIVTGVSMGTSAISYTLFNGCKVGVVLTVSTSPAAISGSGHTCQGQTVLLTSATSGGTWISANTVMATVGSLTGIVTGVGIGSTTISYVLSTGCYALKVVSVDPLSPIVGTTSACIGDIVTLTTALGGGTWSSSTPSVATVGSATGIATAIAPGNTSISYTLSTGCRATLTLTVNPQPIAFHVTGGGSFCAGSPGVHVGIDGSVIGVSYKLYRGAALVGTYTGTGSPIDFGIFTTTGVYTVQAVNPATGCTNGMSLSATVTNIPYGPPYVTISTALDDTVCASTSTTFTANPIYGGAIPAFEWRVNGVAVGGTLSTYTYTPVDGDVVSCHLTSSAGCLSTDTTTGYMLVHVIPNLVPGITISVAPNDSVCAGTPVVLSSSVVNGGFSPRFKWWVNGVVADSSASYSYVPVNGDLVYCELRSSYRCPTASPISSDTISMAVLPYNVPSVTINATPGLSVSSGELVSFTATVTNAGTSPVYQWTVNSAIISGATAATWSSSTLSNDDTVACRVTSSGMCGGVTSDTSVVVQIGDVGVVNIPPSDQSLRLVPNPTNSLFAIAGKTGVQSGRVMIVVTDMLGKAVYTSEASVTNSTIPGKFHLPDEIPNGMYLVTLDFMSFKTILPLVKQ